jgi:hypothetical protein
MSHAQTQCLVDQLDHAGVTLSLTAMGALAASPASHLTDKLRALIRAGKEDLIDWVKAANDSAPLLTTVLPDIGTFRPPGLTPKLLAASLALDASIAAADKLPAHDPDAVCWPYSPAMNGGEIELFMARLHRLSDKGLSQTTGEALADKMVIRDRESDERRVCLECRHLSGYGAGSWRCGNWQSAGIANQSRDTSLPADLVLQLQRCAGFATAMPTAKTTATPNSIAQTPF